LLLFQIIYQEKIKISLDFRLDKANLNKFDSSTLEKSLMNEHSGAAAAGNKEGDRAAGNKEAEENKEDEEEDSNLMVEFKSPWKCVVWSTCSSSSARKGNKKGSCCLPKQRGPAEVSGRVFKD
jgi:hypothetical protein